MPSPQPHPRPGHRPPRGFTLIELMITIAVLVVVMAVAAPQMAEFNANNQVVATKSAFAGAVSLARTEAAKRGRMVFLQALGNGPEGNEFAHGWEIVVDDDGNGAAGDDETRVRRMALTLDKIKLGGTAVLGFRASGALAGVGAEVYTLCRSSGSTRGYSITVTPSGATDVASITTCN
jgi:type IV fimbrial biogenesis protein FimT